MESKAIVHTIPIAFGNKERLEEAGRFLSYKRQRHLGSNIILLPKAGAVRSGTDKCSMYFGPITTLER